MIDYLKRIKQALIKKAQSQLDTATTEAERYQAEQTLKLLKEKGMKYYQVTYICQEGHRIGIHETIDGFFNAITFGELHFKKTGLYAIPIWNAEITKEQYDIMSQQLKNQK
jgi:hypothetical protein